MNPLIQLKKAAPLFYSSARFNVILLAGSALTFALFGSHVAVAQASKGAETIETSQDLSVAPLPGGSYSGDGPLGVLNWSLQAVGDFNGDSKPDYVLYNVSTRQTAIWYMNDNVFVGGAFGPTLPGNWFLEGVADFNGDSKPDYVLLNGITRQTAIWYMNNNTFVSGAFGPTLPAGWFVVGVADFNGDSKPDYVLFNGSQTAIWYMNNNVFVSGAYGPTLPFPWNLRAVGDFDGDSKPDFVLVNFTTNPNQTAIWYMNNNVFVGGALGPTLPFSWNLRAVGDFNGDSKPDYVLVNNGTLQTAIWYMNNNILIGGAFGPTLPP